MAPQRSKKAAVSKASESHELAAPFESNRTMAPQRSKKAAFSKASDSHELAAPFVESTASKSKPKELVVAPPVEANVDGTETTVSAAPVIPKAVTPAPANFSPGTTKASAAPVIPKAVTPAKRIPGPSHPVDKVTQHDNNNEVVATLCLGSSLILNILKANGEPAYKVGLKNAAIEGKDDTQELEIMYVVKHKKDPTLDSKPATVGKNNVPDFVFIAYNEEVPDGIENIKAKQAARANAFQRHTSAYNGKSPKPKARAERIINPNNP